MLKEEDGQVSCAAAQVTYGKAKRFCGSFQVFLLGSRVFSDRGRAKTHS